MNHYSPWAPVPRSYYVGASLVDMGKIKQRREWAAYAKTGADGADTWRDTALTTHTNYTTAFKKNTAAYDSNEELRKITVDAQQAIQFDPSIVSASDSALVDKYHQEALDNLAALVTDRHAISADLAAHWVIKFPAAPPVGSPGVTPEAAAPTLDAHPAPGGAKPSGTQPSGGGSQPSGGGGSQVPSGDAPPPSDAASELSHRIAVVFAVIGLGAAAVAILAPAAALSIYRKVTR